MRRITLMLRLDSKYSEMSDEELTQIVKEALEEELGGWLLDKLEAGGE